MNDWRKDNFPRPQARLPLDAEEWWWREDVSSTAPGLERDAQPVSAAPGTKGKKTAGSSSRRSGSKTGNSRPVPRMPKSRPETQVRSKGITLAGTLLIVGLTVLAFAGGRLFGRVEEPVTGTQVETAAQTVPEPELAPEAPVLEPVEETPVPLPATFARAPIVCLDPGHGGEDRGFSRFFENDIPAMEEAMLVLEQAWDLEARLQQRGYRVVMTRETDAAVNIDGRDVNGDGRTAAHDAPRSNRNKNLDELQDRKSTR